MKRIAGLLIAALCAAPLAASAAVNLTLLTTATNPVGIYNAGDSRLFIVERVGRIRIFKDGALVATPFLDMVSSVNSSSSERGLLGLAFHPSYATNGFFFTYHTDSSGNLVIRRWHVSANADLADAASGVTLLTIPHTTNSNHNGGQLAFGPDGYLYLAPGDGGSSNDPPCNSQNDGVMLGKMLRLDVDQNVNTSPFYGIPATNPHIGAGNPLDEIWAKGLRNPWRFSFDRQTGDLWIADVGQNAVEEINFIPFGTAGGLNFGWKVMEGNTCTGLTLNCTGLPACNSASLTMPVFTYTHSSSRCSITGGFVYRGPSAPSLYGKYVYGDYCTGEIWSLNTTTFASTLVTDQAFGLYTFGEGATGELYVAIANNVYRISEPSNVVTQWQVM